MPQDRESGARASAWGRDTARAIASKIGATLVGRSSNECRMDGKAAVIKCASIKTKSVGVTYKMLSRIESVIGAFQVDGRTFEIRSLTAEAFRTHMRPTRSRGSSAGKVGIVSREVFSAKGKRLSTLRLNSKAVAPLPSATAPHSSMIRASQAAKKYALPSFLKGVLSQVPYERWLRRKAIAHVRRDRKRGNPTATNEEYNRAIHKAVIDSNGRDAYTKERLDWHLISKYDNKSSKEGRRKYKAGFALLPTVDHLGDGLGVADFAICSWRMNDAKGDLSIDEFRDLCRKVLAASHGFT